MVKIASRERGTLGFADPGNYWTQSADSGRRRSAARASRSTELLSMQPAHAGSSTSAQREAGLSAALADDRPVEVSKSAAYSIDSRRESYVASGNDMPQLTTHCPFSGRAEKDILQVWLEARPPEMELFYCLDYAEVLSPHDREELDVLNEETGLPLELIKAWHELAM